MQEDPSTKGERVMQEDPREAYIQSLLDRIEALEADLEKARHKARMAGWLAEARRRYD